MWHLFIISSASLTKNKVSKRTFAADAKAGSLYPPPGHKSCVIPRDIDEDASQNRNNMVVGAAVLDLVVDAGADVRGTEWKRKMR